MLSFEVPIQTVSESNIRCHWGAKSSRAKKQRGAIYLAASVYLRDKPLPERCIVTLTRIASRMLDSDNLATCFKACRDGLADYLGVDDRYHDIVLYRYAQETCKRGVYSVRVTIEPMIESRAAGGSAVGGT